MSLVHYIFPNVSISGGHGDTLMLSKLLPGPTVDRSTTAQFQYHREPVEGAIADGDVLFGRNESGNQHIHDTIRAMTRPG